MIRKTVLVQELFFICHFLPYYFKVEKLVKIDFIFGKSGANSGIA